MSEGVAIGTAFVWDNHVWFVLSAPDLRGQVLCVNLTTLDEECPDDECILSEADYAWIGHSTAVAFSRARLWDAAKIGAALAGGALERPQPNTIPWATVEKVRKSAIASRGLRKEWKALLLPP